MESKNYFGVQGAILNTTKDPLIIKSPDYPQYDNQEIPAGFISSVLTFVYPSHLKLRKEENDNVVSFMLVDKDY